MATTDTDIESQLISELEISSNSLYEEFVSCHQFDTKLRQRREEDTWDLLLGIKGMFSPRSELKELGAKKLSPKYSYPKRTSPEAELYLALIAEPETQGIFLKYISSLFEKVYYKDKKEFILMLKGGDPDFDKMLKEPKNEMYLPFIKKVKQAFSVYERSLIIQPAEFKKIEEAFGAVLGKPISEFDDSQHEYRHYVYHEYLADTFQSFLYPKGIERLMEENPAFSFDGGDSYYHIPSFYDFGGTQFDVQGFVEDLPEDAGRDLKKKATLVGDSIYVQGHNLAKAITSHQLDLRKQKELYVIAQIKTDGSLKDALFTTLLHVNRDMLEYGSEITVSKKGKEILKGVKGKLKKLFRVMLVTEECARDTGYYYFEDKCQSSEFEVLLNETENSTVACWGMTDSIYTFIVVRESPS